MGDLGSLCLGSGSDTGLPDKIVDRQLNLNFESFAIIIVLNNFVGLFSMSEAQGGGSWVEMEVTSLF